MKKKMNPLWKIVSFGKPNKVWLFLCMIFSILSVVVNLAFPIVCRKFVDMVSVGTLEREFTTYLGYLLILLVLGTCNVFMRKISTARFTALTMQNIRNKMAEHIQDLSFTMIKKHHTGDLSSRVNDDLELIRKFFIGLSDFIYQPLIFISAVTYGLILNWKLLVSTVVVLTIALGLNNRVARPLSQISSKVQGLFGKTNSLIQDTVRGIHILKSFNLQRLFQGRYHSLQNQTYEMEMKIVRRRLYSLTIKALLLIVPLQVINLLGGRLTFMGEMTIGEFTAFLSIISYLTSPVNVLITLVTNCKVARAGAQRISEILNYPVEKKDMSKKKFMTRKEDIAVKFENVSFTYDGKNKVLRDITLSLPRNKTIALVGLSGGGKSTILDLLSGFYQIDQGDIQVFGQNLTKINLEDLRTQISMVAQKPHIYPATVAENIGYGKLNSTRSEIIRAAKMANAHDFIVKLSRGYDTLLSEMGTNLSGGQKQRIAIARAILKDAPILLLDEPTSALDPHSEKQIDQALHSFMKQKSVLIVSHRFSTIKNVDEIIVLDKGRIAERGTHHQLIGMGGLYYSLYVKQFTRNNNINSNKGGGFQCAKNRRVI